MAIATEFNNEAKYGFLIGRHLSNSTYKIALYTNAATLNSTVSQYTSTNEVANGNGYTTGGQTLCTYTATVSTGTAWIDWSSDPNWPTSTISAYGCAIYDDTSTDNNILGTWSFGATISSSNGTFTVTFPAAAAGTALLRIA